MKKSLARQIKKVLSDDEEVKRQAVKAGYDSASQSDIPLKDIKDGIIITSDNRYVGVVEILPIDLIKKPLDEQIRVFQSYGALFKHELYKFNLKMMTDYCNPNELIESIFDNCPSQDKEAVKDSLNDYMDFIISNTRYKSIAVRYFIIHEFYQDGEDRIKEEKEIIDYMKEKNDYIRSKMKGCGNLCVEWQNPNRGVMEFLYYFFNRSTSMRETLTDRMNRMIGDYKAYNLKTGEEKSPRFVDFIAPKGLRFINRNYVYMDGIYYGFMPLSSENFPESVEGGWLNSFLYGRICDIDIIGKKVATTTTRFLLNQYNQTMDMQLGKAEGRGNVGQIQKIFGKLENNRTVSNLLSQGDIMFNTAVIITVRASTEKELKQYMKTISRDFKENNIKFDNTFLFAEDYMLMTMPFMFLTPQFNIIKHNMMASQLGSTYSYSSYSVLDKKGVALGVNLDNRTFFAPDNFNTKRFVNGNWVVIGMSGAGKSFNLMTIGERMVLNGVKVMYILPKKGYEYKNACDNIGGSYIRFIPGEKDCINLLEIRPGKEVDASMLDESVSSYQRSLLSQKVQSVVAWFDLVVDNPLTSKQRKIIQEALYNVYGKFGITDDNETIYNEKGKVKEMPILGDLYEEFMTLEKTDFLEEITDVLYSFVNGQYKHLNAQTNVNLKSYYTVFDVDEDAIDPKVFPAYLKIVYDYCYDAMKEDLRQRTALFADEVWKMMSRDESAKQVFESVKLVRGYGACMVLSTQELNDFMKSEYGKSIIANCAIKMLLKSERSQLDMLRGVVGLNDEDCDYLVNPTDPGDTDPRTKGSTKGNCLFITSSDKIKVHISATERQFKAYNTDINQR